MESWTRHNFKLTITMTSTTIGLCSALGATLERNYSLFGNSSLEINAKNTNKISAALSNAFNVNCSAGGFENLSMTIKMVEPQVAPQSAALTLYSINDSNYYTYDLTSALSNSTTIGLWNNLTIPVGPICPRLDFHRHTCLGQRNIIKIRFYIPI